MFVKALQLCGKGVDVSITGNSNRLVSNTRLQYIQKECIEQGKIFSVASGGGTGRTFTRTTWQQDRLLTV